MDTVEHLVIGAGVTGLTFADWVDSDDTLVCEALPEIGGYCRTIHKEGFTWDFSGHFFHFKHPDIEKYLVDRMDDQVVRTIVKQSQVHYKGNLVDFPFQKNIHQLPHEEFLECLVDLFEKEDREPDNFRDMLYVKFGRGIAEKFLIPYNEKLYATDLAQLDVDAMGRFFPYANVEDIVRNFRKADNQSYNSTFTYPEGGAIQYVQAIAKGVRPEQIALNERVLSIDLERKVARTNTREIQYKTIVSTTPFGKLLQMANVPHDPAVYTYNKVLVFNLGFDRKGPEGLHWIYYPDRDLCFYRLGFYDNIFGTDRMSMYVELGYPADAPINAEIVEERKAQVLLDLKKAGIVTDHQLVADHSVLLDPAYVHITQQSLQDVEAKKALLKEHDVYSIGRYGSWTYCSIEDNIVEARALADMLGASPTEDSP
ncbi:MAG: LPS biosynthesis protein [Myxococcales bacterium]|nr:LPS biosynthesis protein [Myxococcales bacterium]